MKRGDSLQELSEHLCGGPDFRVVHRHTARLGGFMEIGLLRGGWGMFVEVGLLYGGLGVLVEVGWQWSTLGLCIYLCQVHLLIKVGGIF